MTAKTRFAPVAGNQRASLLGFYDEPQAGYTTGDVWFVNSVTGSDTTGSGRSPDAPFASITYAITQAAANNGDRIYGMPGHVETIASAAAALDFTGKAGVAVIGLGIGTNRPKITYTGTDGIIKMAAANCTLQNVWLDANIDEVVTAIAVSAAGCTIDGVDVVEHAAKQFIQFALVTSTDCRIQNCVHHQSTAPAANSLWIQLQAADRFKIINNRIFITTTNSASSSVIESDTTAPVNGLLADNVIVQLGGASVIPIKMVAATSGFAIRNTVASPKTAIAGSIALASMYGANNYAGHVVNTNGLLEPVVDA